MKYDTVNKSYEKFKRKYDKFEEKYYTEMQDYKEFKKENFSNMDIFTRIMKGILIAICIILMIFSILVIGLALTIFLQFTVFSDHSFYLIIMTDIIKTLVI